MENLRCITCEDGGTPRIVWRCDKPGCGSWIVAPPDGRPRAGWVRAEDEVSVNHYCMWEHAMVWECGLPDDLTLAQEPGGY